MPDTIELFARDEDLDDIILVVTAWTYCPARPHTFREEGWPAEVEVLDGYALRDVPDGDPEPIAADVDELIRRHWQAVSGDLYKQARRYYDDVDL